MKKLIILILLVASVSFAADTKTSALTELSAAPELTDVVYILDGSTSKKITIANLLGLIDGENIGDDTIDDDSIDFSDVTLLDFGLATTHDTASELDALYEGELTNEAGLYAALNDVTEFIEAGDAFTTGTITVSDTNIGMQTDDNSGDYFGVAAYDGSAYKQILKFYNNSDPYMLFGDGATNVVKVDELGAMTFEGTADINLPSNSVDNADMSDNSVDSAEYVDGSIDLVHMSTDSVNYLKTTGSIKALTPVTDDADDFAANFTGANLYGGTFVANAAGDVDLPSPVAGMNFTVITMGDIEVDALPNTDHDLLLDGVQLDDNHDASNTGSAGDIAVFQYYDSTGWLVTTNGWTEVED